MTEVGETQAAREERHARRVETADRFLANVETVVHGKRRELELVLAALACHGHVLLEDVPGTAKTVLARAIAQTVEGARHARIQCTPDLQPSDATGLSVYNQREREFEFRAGPIFANVVLVDEINRAMPKTQSALLEAMAERQVTVDGATRELPDPFLLLATENPIEHEGTFPLPEAQLDRFFLRTSLGYPSAEVEREIVREQRHGHPLGRLEPAVSLEELRALQQAVEEVYVDALIERWLDRSRPRHAGARRGRDRRVGARLARARAGGARVGAPARPRPRRPRGRGGALPAGPRAPRDLLDAVPRRASPHRPQRRARALPGAPASSARRAPIRRRPAGLLARSGTGTTHLHRRPDLPARPAPPPARAGVRRDALGAARARLRRRRVASVPPRRRRRRDRLGRVGAALLRTRHGRVHRARAVRRGGAARRRSSATGGPGMGLYPEGLPWLRKPEAVGSRSS